MLRASLPPQDVVRHRLEEQPTPLVMRRPGLWVAAGLLLALHAGLAWQLSMPSIATGNDDALYVILARALRSFRYADLHYVGEPTHAQYPPVFPALLAVVGALFGDRMGSYVALNIVLSTAALALAFDATRRRWSPALALMLLAVCAVNPMLLRNAGQVMSEAAFTALVMLALWALTRSPSPDAPVSPSTLAVAGAASVAAALTRSAGVTAVAAFLLYLLLERRWRAALVFAAVAAATVGAWLSWTIVAPQEAIDRSYLLDATFREPTVSDSRIGELLRRVSTNTVLYATQAIPARLPLPSIRGTTVDNWIWMLLLAVLAALGGYALWRRWRPAFLVLGAYLTLLVVWTWTVPRFVDPALPLLLLVLLAGASALGGRWRERGRVVLPLVLSLVIAATALAADSKELRTVRSCRAVPGARTSDCFNADQLSFFSAAAFARDRTPPDAAFLTAREATFAYLAGRQVVPIATALAPDSAGFAEYLASKGVDYAYLSHLGSGDVRLLRSLIAHCHRLELVERFPPRALLFRLRPDRTASDEACRALEEYRRTAGPLLPIAR